MLAWKGNENRKERTTDELLDESIRDNDKILKDLSDK